MEKTDNKTDNLIKLLEQKSRCLNKEKLMAVLDFVDYLIEKYDEKLINKGIAALASKSKSFEFLSKEPDLYSLKDIK